ncbi:MAG: MCE family protein [Mycobacterium sp.]|nr:MCE family protein [Mycobacterium sp.]
MSALWRSVLFAIFGLLCIFALLLVFANLRFDTQNSYTAQFTNVSNLENGNFVRVAGVEVGKVKKITIHPDEVIDVEFTADKNVVLTEGSRAVIRWEDIAGRRYLALEEGAGGTKVLRPGSTIPLSNTAPSLDLDSLTGGLRPLFRALDPQQINQLTGQLIGAFQGEGDAIASILTQTASVTNTLADRDELIGQVITNLNTVLASAGDQSEQLDKAVTGLSQLVKTLADRRGEISTGLAYTNAATGTIADLLSQAKAPLKDTLTQGDRVGTLAVADYAYLDNIINQMPEKYRLLGRQGLYGDYFSFYLCDLLLKVNGKGGEPVYIKVASQATGRCTPK